MNTCTPNTASYNVAVACVDVLIAARNRADTIQRAVRSAPAEAAVRTVIVVDDGSTDDTAALARLCDPDGKRVIVERLGSSHGPAAARNVAIGITTAPWLAVLDADDFFLPRRVGFLLAHAGDWDFVADDLIHIAESRSNHTTPFPNLLSGSMNPQPISFEQFVLGNVSRRGSHRTGLGYLQPLIRRQFLDQHALRYDEALRFGEDYVLYARALAAGARFLFLPKPGYIAIERADSLSARHTRQDLEALLESDRALLAIDHLTSGERDALAEHHSDINRRAQWLVLAEALRSHNFRRFLGTFFQSRTLTLYLTRRLLEEIPLQIRRRLEACRQPVGKIAA